MADLNQNKNKDKNVIKYHLMMLLINLRSYLMKRLNLLEIRRCLQQNE